MQESNGQFKSGNNANPKGSGGFKVNPQNINRGGRPKNQESITHWLRTFKGMTVADFNSWKEQTPQDEITMASDLAYTLMSNARKSLKELKEVTDRTEGKASQKIDIAQERRIVRPLIISDIKPRPLVIPGITPRNS